MLFVVSPLISFMVTMVISPFSWFFDKSFAFVSPFVEMWLSCFQAFSWVSCWYKLISRDEFLLKLSSLLSLIKSRLLVWHCWLICVVVVSVAADESSWIGVLALDCGDDNCVTELLTFVLWLLPRFDGSALNRLLQAWWDDGDVEVGMLLIIPVRWLKMLPVVSLDVLFDKTVLRWDLKERKAKIKWEWKWNTNDGQLQLLISGDFYILFWGIL